MPEHELHHEHGHDNDPLGKTIGLQAALLAVALAIVTIGSHRAHTDGVMTKADLNDKWNYYQATKLKLHNVELGADLVTALGAKGDEAKKVQERFEGDKKKYEEKADKLKEDAEATEKKCERIEERAFKLDVGEGLLEIGLVLSSLYFISKKVFFPVIGLLSGLAGLVVGVIGFIH